VVEHEAPGGEEEVCVAYMFGHFSPLLTQERVFRAGFEVLVYFF
jgi:hypothetical protein